MCKRDLVSYDLRLSSLSADFGGGDTNVTISESKDTCGSCDSTDGDIDPSSTSNQKVTLTVIEHGITTHFLLVMSWRVGSWFHVTGMLLRVQNVVSYMHRTRLNAGRQRNRRSREQLLMCSFVFRTCVSFVECVRGILYLLAYFG